MRPSPYSKPQDFSFVSGFMSLRCAGFLDSFRVAFRSPLLVLARSQESWSKKSISEWSISKSEEGLHDLLPFH